MDTLLYTIIVVCGLDTPTQDIILYKDITEERVKQITMFYDTVKTNKTYKLEIN